MAQAVECSDGLVATVRTDLPMVAHHMSRLRQTRATIWQADRRSQWLPSLLTEIPRQNPDSSITNGEARRRIIPMSDDLNPAPRKRLDQPEHGLSHWVDRFLDRVLLPMGPCWYTAIEAGVWLRDMTPQARMNFEQKRRARGIKPDHLDWYAWQGSTGLFTQFELKVNGNVPTKGQLQTLAALQRQNIPTAKCETVPEVCRFLLAAGFELHRNAVNIATELHERFLAERRKAKGPREARGGAQRSAAAGVAMGHRLGVWK